MKANNVFKINKDDPPPLTVETTRRVRFHEVDSLGIVWHGNYASFIEEGRETFGARYDIGYLDMYRAGFLAPIVKMHIDYITPMTIDDEVKISTSLYWSESVRLNFQYTITGPDNRVVASAYTVQLLLNLERNVLLTRPPMYEDFCTNWKEKWHS